MPSVAEWEANAGVLAPKRGWRARWGSWSRRDRIALWVTLLTAPLRVAFVVWVHPPSKWDYSDMFWYHRSALGFLDQSHPTSAFDWYYPSGTPTMIAACIFFFGPKAGVTAVGVVQALLNALEVPLVYRIGKRAFGERVGLAAMLLFATHYLALGFSGMMMSESWLTIGLIGAMALFDSEKAWRCLLAGLALGFGAWAKSQAMLLAPLWALLLLWKRRYWSAVAVGVGTAAVVVPMSILASVRLQRPVLLSPNGGQTFALGQCPIKSIYFDDPISHTGANFGLPDVFQRAVHGEVESSWGDAHYAVPFFDSGFYFREGLACLKHYPRYAIRALFRHLTDTFAGTPWSTVSPWPEVDGPAPPLTIGSNLFVAYAIAPLAFYGLWRRRREHAIWFLFGLPLVSLLASAALFHGDPRFRLPYDFAFFLAAAAGLGSRADERHLREVVLFNLEAREP